MSQNPGDHFTLILMEAKFFRFLKIVGVGYKARAEAEGHLLFLKLGYSHEVELTVPPANEFPMSNPSTATT
jgi:large subunit ribosomal protein L6